KIAGGGSANRERKLCCVSSMEGGGTEYPETSDGKPPKPGVSRKHPDRMQCSPPALPDPVCFWGKPGLHKGTGGQGENRILVAVFLVSILSALKF
ncbi:hypothetical protein CX823_22295, partial [Salmonella enterica subsp. diarizonae serovar 61:k:1,5,7]|nr:hypothetical protein [Salmonella enterica subsp. diarizonae]ECG9108394.1 hypothetical protein [Salmonella enterica subsp. enterica]EDO2877156.1 hypothetical protein [Salmonella enterica subsp. diarizonae serovar 61:k:1,5,7]EDR4451786.1 hypothetical protein [Salmonella enterica]ECC1604230.1 hypothetical protein [Salmonella enterica subsp. diarizonae]